jgi:hemerythrin superfamily protein
MDAITYLRQEHSKVRQMLKQISDASDDKAKYTKFVSLCKDLYSHESTEEAIWYPALRKDPDMRDIIKHLVEEEKSATKAMKKLLDGKVGIIWKLKFYKFKHDVDHHARSEEKELFPKARKYLSKVELNALGTAMQKFKNKIKA